MVYDVGSLNQFILIGTDASQENAMYLTLYDTRCQIMSSFVIELLLLKASA